MRLRSELNAVFLAAGDNDEAARFHARQRLGDPGFIFALVLGAEHQRTVIVLAFDLRRHINALRLKLAIEGPEALDGG